MSLLLDRLRSQVVAVVRAPDEESAVRGAKALLDGGVRHLEITYSTPGAAAVVARLRRELGDDAVVGAGTVTTVEQVVEAVGAGAQFLVSPGVRAPVARAMREADLPVMLGALTPTEVMVALDHGADVVKLFPGSLGGPAYLKALRGPFPDVRFMPTGGVSVENAAEWLAGGAFCLGVGGDLVSVATLRAGDWAGITRRAQAFMVASSPSRVGSTAS